MANIYQGPVPTRFVALSGLHALLIGEKVRFLGWLGLIFLSSLLLHTHQTKTIHPTAEFTYKL
jgi:hypothetical protein